ASGDGGEQDSARAYSVLSKGVEVFHANAKLAPEGVFRYRLYLGDRSRAVEPTLRLSGGRNVADVKLGRGLTFSLPEVADKSDSSLKLIATPAGDGFNWRAEVKSPGGALGARRLGDLRLECLVDAQSNLNNLQDGKVECVPAAAKEASCLDDMRNCAKYAPAAVGTALWDMLKGASQLKVDRDPYEARQYSYLFISDRPLFSISLQQGGRALVLPTEWLYGLPQQRSPFFHWPYPKQYLYSLPLSDASWSNDALVVFEYMDPV
ncbi:hypothetical protein, partial [Chromobacterium phragmitis]